MPRASFYQDKSCLITGASRGIGAGLARELAQRGAKLTLLARNENDLTALHEELTQQGAEVAAVIGDVTLEADVKRCAQAALDHFEAIDVVFANAGISVQALFADMTMEDLRWVMEVNFFGVVRTIQATLPHLRKRPESRISIISSLAGKMPLAASSAYSASKFALQGLGLTLRVEEESLGGPKVTLVCPGFVESDIRNKAIIRGGGREDPPEFLVMPTQAAAKEIADAMIQAPAEVMITGHAKLAEKLLRVAPHFLTNQISKQVLKRLRMKP